MIETPNGLDILAALRDVAAEMFRGDDLPNIYTDAANEIQTLRSNLERYSNALREIIDGDPAGATYSGSQCVEIAQEALHAKD